MEDILNNITNPKDLKKLNYEDKKELAEEIRSYIIDVVSKNGGHLASNLGVVELTIALHSIFDTPKDKIICTQNFNLKKKSNEYLKNA